MTFDIKRSYVNTFEGINSKESTLKGRGLALTPKGFYAKAGMTFLFKEISC